MSTANLIRARPTNYVEIPGRKTEQPAGMIPITATSGNLLEPPKRKRSNYEEEAVRFPNTRVFRGMIISRAAHRIRPHNTSIVTYVCFAYAMPSQCRRVTLNRWSTARDKQTEGSGLTVTASPALGCRPQANLYCQ